MLISLALSVRAGSWCLAIHKYRIHPTMYDFPAKLSDEERRNRKPE